MCALSRAGTATPKIMINGNDFEFAFVEVEFLQDN